MPSKTLSVHPSGIKCDIPGSQLPA